MKIDIDVEEFYPVYTLDNEGGWGRSIEVTEEESIKLIAEYHKIMKDFWNFQSKLRTLYNNE